MQDGYHTLRPDQQGNFHFPNVVLTNAVAGPATWRLKVALAPGQHSVLDLPASNGTAVRDDVSAVR